MNRKPIVAIAWLFGTVLSGFLAQHIYFQLGYAGPDAELALAKYWLHINRSGGILQEHIGSYAEDRAGSIAVGLTLAVSACACAVRAWRALAQPGTPRDGFAAREL